MSAGAGEVGVSLVGVLGGSLSRAAGFSSAGGYVTDLHLGVVQRAVAQMATYSARTGREACGWVVHNADGAQAWAPLVNVVPVSAGGAHKFAVEAAQAEQVLAAVGRVGGGVVATLHSHPYVEMGVPGWAGPSGHDRRQAALADQQTLLAGGDPSMLPEMAVWCPNAGRAGVLVGYDDELNLWSWHRGGAGGVESAEVE